MPIRMPPLTWLSQVSLLTIRPPSWTQVIFFTLVKPVSVSTSTSANWTPPAPLEDRPCCHFPETTSGSTPSFLQAADHFSASPEETPVLLSSSALPFVQTS